jgi:hypothetical protein
MKLVRFSDTQHHVDQNGTLSIIIGKETVLKLSPVDSLISCLEQVKRLLPADRIGIAEDVINRVMTVMDIPQDVSDRVSEGFHENEKKIIPALTNDNDTDTIQESQQEDILSDLEKDWLSFVERFVNEDHPTCTFSVEEMNDILDGECIDKFVNFFEKRYLIENDGNSTKISVKKV